MACSLWPPARTSSTTLICGMAKRSPAHSTTRAETIARVSGILMMKVDPRPATDFSSMVPPIFSMLVRTTSRPTPRPETEVTFSAVEKPGLKMNCWICWSVMAASSASVASPLATALALILPTDRPRPSSVDSMMMWPPS